ncbi:MAG: hypothetical protein H6601_08470 [Flavobacteriales bacterium]|nr:hypothetical protein [Flavobacteriales bacterium]
MNKQETAFSSFHFLPTLILWMMLGLPSMAQIPSPGEMPEKAIILTGGIAHIGNGQVLENAAIGMENGKITFVKPMGSVKLNPEEADIIDITGKHVYPGFISPNNTLGLTEIEAVRATNDYAETGAFNPEVRALTSFNTDSKISTTVRSNGVLIAQATPRSGRICGTSSVMHLDGWNWEDAVLEQMMAFISTGRTVSSTRAGGQNRTDQTERELRQAG